MSDEETTSLIPGQTVGEGRFVLREVLGAGGMGVVWLAEDTHLSEPVALKFLPEEWRNRQSELETLRREASKGHRLSHPCIVRIHDLFLSAGDIPFVSMEYVPGNSLSALKSQQPDGRFGWEELKPFLRQLIAALDYAHQQKVLHRDLKPANIMIADDGCLKLADFGISATLSEADQLQTSDHGISGTLAYMSPQQLDGMPPSRADDVYSLGATIYDLLTGKPPFFTGDLKYQVRNLEPPPIVECLRQRELSNDLPATAAGAIMACLDKDPDRRPDSVPELLRMFGVEPLSGFGDTNAGSASQPGLMQRLRGSAAIACQQVLIKKLELVDLREALQKVGDQVVAADSAPERFETRVKSFELVDGEIAELRAGQLDSSDSGFASIAKNVGRAAKVQAEIESRQLRRKQLLVEMGQMAVDEPEGIPGIGPAITNVHAIRRKIDEARAEISRIETTANPLFRRPLALVGATLLIVFLTYLFWPSPDVRIVNVPDPVEPTHHDNLQQRVDFEESIEAAHLRVERERSQRREAAEKRQRDEEKAAARKVAAARMAKRAEAKRKEEAAQKEHRKQEAERLFTAVGFNPDFRFSKSLQRYGATAELRGKNAGEIPRLYREKQWLDLINLLLDSKHAELPEMADIEDAVQTLRDYRFFVLARIRIFDRTRQPLFLVTFSDKHEGYVNFDYRWEPHPDRIGYTKAWSPSDGRALIVISDTSSMAKSMKSLQQYYRTQRSRIMQKRKLGELTEEGFRNAMKAVQDSVYTSVQKWVQSK